MQDAWRGRELLVYFRGAVIGCNDPASLLDGHTAGARHPDLESAKGSIIFGKAAAAARTSESPD